MTVVPMNIVFLCSIFGRNLPLRVAGSFFIEFDSPVRIDSLHSSWNASVRRASAAIFTPGSRTRMSPGTISVASISIISSLRMTFACGEIIA